MGIDFSKVTAITTPSGSLSKINRTSDSVELWPNKNKTIAENLKYARYAIGINYINYYYISTEEKDIQLLKDIIADTSNNYITCSFKNVKITLPIKNAKVASYYVTYYVGRFGSNGTPYKEVKGTTGSLVCSSLEQTAITANINDFTVDIPIDSRTDYYYYPGIVVSVAYEMYSGDVVYADQGSFTGDITYTGKA